MISYGNEDGEEDSGGEEQEINYTHEQKIVAAVWMHEKQINNQTSRDIKNNFQIRFKLKPPKTSVLTMWENQLFSKGKIQAVEQGDEGKDNINIDELSDVRTSEEENSD